MKVNIAVLLFMIIISSSCGNSNFPKDLGGGYNIDYDGNGDWCILNKQNSVVIPPHITKYNYNGSFIIAEDKPRWIILGDAGPHIKYNEEEEKFEKSSLRYYWIIDKTEKDVFDEETKSHSSIYGPLNKTEYQRKLAQLKVPNNLRLN